MLSAMALLYAFGMLRNTTRGFDRADFSCYYSWARAARENLNPYTADLEPTAARFHLNMEGMEGADYPPTFILLFEPLASLSPKSAYWIWTGVNVAALAAVLLMLLGGDSGLDLRLRLILAALAIFYYPIRINFHWAQPQPLLLLMLLLAGRWLGRGEEAAAGGMLALAGLIKIFPLFMAGYLVAGRRWRALLFTGVGLALGAAVTMAIIGLPITLASGARLANVANGQWLVTHHKADSEELVSFGNFVSRLLFQVTGAHPGSALGRGRGLIGVLAALALMFVTVRATLTRPAGRNRDERAFALWIATTVLVAPTAWIHYMVLLLVPLAELALAANRGEASRRALWMGGASYALAQVAPGAFAVFKVILPAAVAGPLVQNWFPCVALLAYGSAYCLAVD